MAIPSNNVVLSRSTHRTDVQPVPRGGARPDEQPWFLRLRSACKPWATVCQSDTVASMDCAAADPPPCVSRAKPDRLQVRHHLHGLRQRCLPEGHNGSWHLFLLGCQSFSKFSLTCMQFLNHSADRCRQDKQTPRIPRYSILLGRMYMLSSWFMLERSWLAVCIG
jgi:hypothetical protein